jgi:hypothetical protein
MGLPIPMTSHPTDPIRADIAHLAWLTGRWVGMHGSEEIEEHWSTVAGGGMIGMFRAIADGHPRFYELITFDTQGKGLACRFRHFNRDLTAWEKKAEPLELDLVELTDRDAVFLRRGKRRWMTYRRVDPEHLIVFFESDEEARDPEDEYRFVRG